MKRLRQVIPFCSVLLAMSACSDERPPAEPSLIRTEKPAPASTVSEPLQMPQSGEGNFEALIADYEDKKRAIWQKPDMVISLLGDLEGKTVADIGAGTGYFTFRMVPKAQKVIGIDIDQRFIDFMDSIKVRLPGKYSSHFESRLAKYDDPLLRAEEADAVVVVNTYGYIENRVQYLKKLWVGVKPGGRLLIIDFKKNNLPVGPPDEFKVSIAQVERELNAAGFSVTKIDNEALDYQYIVIAKKP